MPNVKQLHKIIAYDKDNKIFGTFDVRTWSFEDAFKEYMEMCQLLGQGKFVNVHRLDFVGGNHLLFVFSDVRSVINQNNSVIMEMCQLLGQGKFVHVHRLDFVGGNHLLFVFSDVRSVINQNNSIIKIKCYD